MATKPETAVQDKDTSTTQVETNPPVAPDAVNTNEPQNITGRAVFAVETTAAGVVVRTAFLTEDNRLLDMPAVFPNMVYAMNVLDDLRNQVMQHFSQAAQVGAQVIANQARAQQEQQQGQPAEADKAST